MTEFLETCFAGPVLPASILLLLVTLYWLLFIVGAVGLDLLDLDLDFDVDIDTDSMFDSVMSAGAASLKFLNIGKMPFNIWLSVFALCFWVISLLWQTSNPPEGIWLIVGLTVRNAVVALVPAKLLTQPLRGRFAPVEPPRGEELIGRHGEVATGEISQRGGQARFSSDGAPLLLNVRTLQGVLPKGETVEIVDYIAEEHIYLVEKASKKVIDEVGND